MISPLIRDMIGIVPDGRFPKRSIPDWMHDGLKGVRVTFDLNQKRDCDPFILIIIVIASEAIPYENDIQNQWRRLLRREEHPPRNDEKR